MDIKILFNNFIGTWQITRILGEEGIAEGLAQFVLQSADHIIYREELKVTFKNSTMTYKAYKEYIFFYDSTNDRIIKKFTDGTKFYDLNFQSNNQSAYGEYLCAKDNYKASYDFLNENKFTLKYEVDGPYKAYSIDTEFVKLDTDIIGGIKFE